MPHDFTMTRMVEFAETDMAGIMHFSNYFRLMEATEHAFFRSVGLHVHHQTPDEMRGWVRVHVECHYAAPLRYQDEVEVHLMVRAKKPKAIDYDFIFRRIEDGRKRPVAYGAMTVVCVERGKGETKIRSVAIPAAVDEIIEVAPSEMLRAEADWEQSDVE